MDQLWRDLTIWLVLALAASLISLRLGLSVALAEILVGIAAGNTIHPPLTPWVTFLASFGALVLTFLAGAELETEVLRRHWRASLAIGFASFLLPFLVCWLAALFLLRWEPRAAQIAGITTSTTSVAVVYAVTLETGLNEKPWASSSWRPASSPTSAPWSPSGSSSPASTAGSGSSWPSSPRPCPSCAA